MVAQPALDRIEYGSTARLEVVDVDQTRVVYLNGYRVAVYPHEDRATERVVVTQMCEVSALQQKEIAELFGVHVVTVNRWCVAARDGGGAALLPEKRGPKGPSKLDGKLIAEIVSLREEEKLSLRAIAARLSRGNRTISHGSVKNVLDEHGSKRQLALATGERKGAGESGTDEIAEIALAGSTRSRYAGALLLYAGLEQLDLWRVLEGLGASVGAVRQIDWRRVVAALVLCFVLRFRSIEDLKNASCGDLGVVLGLKRAPGIQDLRQKLIRLAESVEPVRLTRELFRRYVELEPVWEGVYYVDGHFLPYSGQLHTPKGWNPHRRLATRGRTDTYVHDVRGRALFFLSRPLNDSLARAIPSLAEEIRTVHGEGRFTLIFDRGGYSKEAFRYLNGEGLGFITYLKGRKAKRRYPLHRFARSWYAMDGKRVVYEVYEKKTRVAGAGLVRTVVYRTQDGTQIPVLTNLDGTFKPAKIVHLLRLRWAQENSLKYLKQHYAIDQIVQYGAKQEEEDRLVNNPKRKALKQKIREVQKEIQSLEAEIGQSVDDAKDSRTRTVRTVRGELRKKRLRLERLENRHQKTPARLPASQVDSDGPRFLLSEERRLALTALKMAGYNAERLLALQFNHHYQQSKDLFSVFRALFHLSGTVRKSSPDRLAVKLERPTPEKVAHALQAFLDQINRQAPRLLGNGPRLVFSLDD